MGSCHPHGGTKRPQHGELTFQIVLGGLVLGILVASGPQVLKRKKSRFSQGTTLAALMRKEVPQSGTISRNLTALSLQRTRGAAGHSRKNRRAEHMTCPGCRGLGQFLNPGTAEILGQKFSYLGRRGLLSAPCNMSSIPNLYVCGCSSTTSSCCEHQKCPQPLLSVLGDKITPGWEPLTQRTLHAEANALPTCMALLSWGSHTVCRGWWAGGTHPGDGGASTETHTPSQPLPTLSSLSKCTC